MGERPEGKELDRIDTNGNYEPSNCRWATNSENNRNKRNNRMIEFDGKRMCLAGWSELIGVSWTALYYRIFRYKWPLERALKEPVNPLKSHPLLGSSK